jgi:HSP20 family molecular chaperone IbpA
MNRRTKITPCVCIFQDDKHGELKIVLKLLSIDKKDISLEMMKEGLCLLAAPLPP